MLNPSCPFCGSNSVESLYHEILICNNCNLQFYDKIMRVDAGLIYNEEYYRGKVYRDYFDENSYRRKLFGRKINRVKKYLPSKGRVLDIGSAAGYFLDEMKQRDYKTYGIDISEYAVNRVRSNTGHSFFAGELANAGFSDSFFSLVSLWDVLEHLKNPVSILNEIYRILRKDGRLVIETLNSDSLGAKIYKDKWPLYFPPYHLYYFHTDLIKTMLEKSGFKLFKTVPVQTYLKSWSGYKTFRYFRYPVVRSILGRFFDDVVIYIAVKVS